MILGIDVGGSFAKATAFDLGTGTGVTRGRAVPPQHPAPGHNEREPLAVWFQVADLVHEVVSALPAGARITAVGVTGHGNGLYLVDRKGQPTRPAVMASDTRAADLVAAWIADGVEERLRPVTWNRLWPGQPGPVLAWLARNEPSVVARSAAALMCKDFIRAQLTGRVATERTDASCSGLYDNAAGETSTDVLLALGLEAYGDLVPEVLGSDAVVGEVTPEAAEVTGLPVGTPVVGGLVDNVALHLGSGVLDSRSLCVAAGTWSVNQLLVPDEEMVPAQRLSAAAAPFAACTAATPGAALLIEASATSASTLAWAVDQVTTGLRPQAERSGSDVFELALRRVAARAPQDDDPFFLPFLDGSRDDPQARGAWLGLSSWNDETALLGAVVEGVCLEHRRHVDRLSPRSDALPLRLSGGAARSAAWAQRFADTTRRPVEVSSSQELGAVGVAVIAGVGAGVFGSAAEGAAALDRTWTVFTPDDDAVAHFERRYARYLDYVDRLDLRRG
ncbi:carbohydrate kinase [Cellulomonas carbonis]|nr:carbohydrate kinase [Cellulomonas carbonis]